MMHSPMWHMLMMVTWLITALAAVHIGLTAFGVDLAANAMFQNPTVMMAAKYIIGISGAISLLMFLMWGMGGAHHCKHCNNNPCTCK